MTSALIAKIHIAKKQLGLDDDLYRDTLRRITGKSSSGAMTENERQKVLDHFSKAGFKAHSRRRSMPISGPAARHARKIEALWLSGWNLGVIHDRSAAAMESFIARQTGIAKAQWLKDAGDAGKVIEALKAWLAREGGVAWGKDDAASSVLNAQWRKCAALGIEPSAWVHDDAIEEQQRLGRLIRAAKGKRQ